MVTQFSLHDLITVAEELATNLLDDVAACSYIKELLEQTEGWILPLLQPEDGELFQRLVSQSVPSAGKDDHPLDLLLHPQLVIEQGETINIVDLKLFPRPQELWRFLP